MAEHAEETAPAFESPITASYSSGGSTGLTLRDESSVTKLIVRAGIDSVAASQLAVAYGASRAAGQVLITGQRPTEWLLIGDGEPVNQLALGLDRHGHVSVIDHTHSRALFRLTGLDATRVLEKICDLDWSDDMTPDGAVVSASVAKVNGDIVRHDQGGEPSYLLACDRSFAQYLFDAVLDAGTEFGLLPEV